jgi:hypothetical protein
MPSDREIELYNIGYNRGYQDAMEILERTQTGSREGPAQFLALREMKRKKPKRKLSAWQKYIKNKRNHIKYRDGKLNLKKMGVEFRRKKRR